MNHSPGENEREANQLLERGDSNATKHLTQYASLIADPNVLHGRSIRDIEAGEELGEDYGSFTTTECWESMGFGIWKEDTFGFTTKK